MFWFPVEVDRWLRSVHERKGPWCYTDRIVDLRALVWEWGRVPLTRRELQARWSISRPVVDRHFTDIGRADWMPSDVASFWLQRWKDRSPAELRPQ